MVIYAHLDIHQTFSSSNCLHITLTGQVCVYKLHHSLFTSHYFSVLPVLNLFVFPQSITRIKPIFALLLTVNAI